MRTKLFLALVLGASITACSSPQTTYTSQGANAYRLSCGGFFGDGDLGGCYQQAGDICREQGFRVIQSSVSSIIIECRTHKSDGEHSLPLTQ